MAFQEAHVLDGSGKLTPQAIGLSKHIPLKDEVIGNPIIVRSLTQDGSKIIDWKKYKTPSVLMPNGQSKEIHFYKNDVTGAIDYSTVDFKVKNLVKP